jgi:hypothetical protein
MSKTQLTGLLFGLLTIVCSSCHKEENYTAYFGGEVTNPRTPYIILSKGTTVIDTIPLDKNNRFFVKFDSLTPGMYSFTHEPDYQYVYFDKNDSLMVSVNTADFDNSLVFSGRGDKKNNFMMEQFLLNEKDRAQPYDLYDFEFKKFKKTIDSSFAIRREFYKKNKQQINWDSDFDFYALNRLNLSYFAKKEYYSYVHTRRTGQDVKAQIPKSFYDYRKTINFNDPRLTSFSPFIRYTTAMINNMAIMESHKNGNTQENSLDDNINKLNIADSLFKNQNIKNDFLNNIAFTYFLEDQNIVNNQKFIKRYLELSTSSSENDEIRKIDRGIKQLQPGNRLPEVELVGMDDKPFKLIGHTNRQTVIFFWTSCAHAHIKTVYDTTEALKKQFPDTDFIAVNVDDEQEWKKMMAVYKPNASVQVRAVNFQEIKDKWVLTKITRTIILNPNGTIKNAFTNLKDPNFSENLK